MSDRIQELRELDNTPGFGNPYLTEALDGWEKAEKWKAAHMTDHHATCREVDKRAERAEAERDQLREALEEIAAARNWTIHIECFGVVMRLADRARAALTQENPDSVRSTARRLGIDAPLVTDPEDLTGRQTQENPE